jgi:hypothetical protein
MKSGLYSSIEMADRLAAALNEIDEFYGTTFNDFQIIEFITHYGPLRFGVDMDAFNAVEVCWPAMVCNQYRFIIPVGTEADRSVVLWNRVSGAWEALSEDLMPSFVCQALETDERVVAA